jgi:quercetin dioxygenase-like cupin family protein
MNTPDSMNDEIIEQQVFAELGAAFVPAPMVAAQRDALRARIVSRTLPPPDGTTTYRVSDDGWFDAAPNVRMKLLRRDLAEGTQEMLIRLGAGVRVPEHSHRKEEQMIILEGECHLGGHLLRAGDTHVAPPGSWHPAITVEHSVLMLLRSEYPLPAG